MNGIIGFEDLCVRCIIGVDLEERMQAQPLFIDLKVKPAADFCGESDSILDTVNYVELAALCEKTAVEGRYHLLEKAAHEILAGIFDRFPVSWAWIKIKKLQAIPQAKNAIIEMERSL